MKWKWGKQVSYQVHMKYPLYKLSYKNFEIFQIFNSFWISFNIFKLCALSDVNLTVWRNAKYEIISNIFATEKQKVGIRRSEKEGIRIRSSFPGIDVMILSRFFKKSDFSKCVKVQRGQGIITRVSIRTVANPRYSEVRPGASRAWTSVVCRQCQSDW